MEGAGLLSMLRRLSDAAHRALPSRRTVLQIVAIGAAAVVLMSPTLIYGMSQTDSSRYDYIWTKQFDDLMLAGQIYPRWMPQSFAGYGSPAFYFYPPLSFFIVSLVNLLTFNAMSVPYLIAVAQTLILGASGLAMLIWLRNLTEPRAAIIGALLYMSAPYHLTDYYWRGALAEFTFFTILPLVFHTLRAANRGWRGVPGLALTYALLICAHLPSALFTSLLVLPTFAIFLAVREAALPRAAGSLLRVAVGSSLGLGLAAVYLAPALLLQGSISSAQLWRPYYVPATWLITNPDRWPLEPLLFMITSFALGALSILLACLARSRQAGSGERLYWISVGLLSVILATLGPKLFWTTIPLMTKLQFPWRLMSIVEFATATTLAMAFPNLTRRAVLVLGTCCSLVYYPGFVILVSQVKPRLQNAQMYWASFVPSAQRNMPDASEYFPAGFPDARIGNAPSPEIDNLPDMPVISCQPVAILCQAKKLDVSGAIALSIQSEVALTVYARRFYFPNWRAVDATGKAFPLTPSLPLQTVSVRIPAGRYNINLYPGTPEAERLGLGIFISSALVTLMLAAVLAWRSRSKTE